MREGWGCEGRVGRIERWGVGGIVDGRLWEGVYERGVSIVKGYGVVSSVGGRGGYGIRGCKQCWRKKGVWDTGCGEGRGVITVTDCIVLEWLVPLYRFNYQYARYIFITYHQHVARIRYYVLGITYYAVITFTIRFRLFNCSQSGSLSFSRIFNSYTHGINKHYIE